MRRARLSFRAVADAFNREGLTCRGGGWDVTTLQRALARPDQGGSLAVAANDKMLAFRAPSDAHGRAERLQIALARKGKPMTLSAVFVSPWRRASRPWSAGRALGKGEPMTVRVLPFDRPAHPGARARQSLGAREK